MDHIIGLSIVGGTDVGCIFEPEQVLYSSEKLGKKLSVCATISDNVFSAICRRSVGIRDLLDILLALKEMGGRVEEGRVVDYIEEWFRQSSLAPLHEFQDFGASRVALERSWMQIKAVLAALKTKDALQVNDLLFADLGVADAIWISVAERSLAHKIPPPGEFGPLIAIATRKSGPYKITCMVGAHMGALNLERVGEKYAPLFEESNLVLQSTLEFGPDSPMRAMIFLKEHLGSRCVHSAVEELRKAVLG